MISLQVELILATDLDDQVRAFPFLFLQAQDCQVLGSKVGMVKNARKW